MGDLVGHPTTVALAVDELVSALRERGLSADPFGGSMVWIATLPGRGRREAVQCRMDDAGRRLGWFWVTSGPDCSASSVPFALVSQIDLAADLIEVRLTGRSAPRPKAAS